MHKTKADINPPAGLLHYLPIPTHHWSHISLDFVIGLPPLKVLPPSSLLLIDSLNLLISSFWSSSPLLLRLLSSSSSTFRIHGIPTDIVFDQGPQFTSQVWQAFCNTLGALSSLTSGYHPQSNGQSDHCNQELETALRYVMEDNPSSWSQQLVCIEYTHNMHTSSDICMSPFKASLDYSPPSFPSCKLPCPLSSITSISAEESGTKPRQPCYALLRKTSVLLIITGRRCLTAK